MKGSHELLPLSTGQERLKDAGMQFLWITEAVEDSVAQVSVAPALIPIWQADDIH